MYSIRHIDIPKDSNEWFVTAEFEKKVSLWSIRYQKKVSEIETHLDFGGERLALVPAPSPIIITGAYERNGVTAYNVDGNLLWQRKDLKKVQIISYHKLNGEYFVGIGFDSRSFLILDVNSGETMATYKGIRCIYSNQDDTLWLAKSNIGVKLLDRNSDIVLWNKKVDAQSVSYSKENILISTYNQLNCFDLDGTERWSYSFPDEHIIASTCWENEEKQWLLILWNIIKGGPKYLYRMSQEGTIVSKEDLGEVWECKFSGNGKFLITSDGEVLNTNHLEVIWKFCDQLL